MPNPPPPSTAKKKLFDCVLDKSSGKRIEKLNKMKSEEDEKSDTREDLALPSCSARRRIRARLRKHE